MKKYWSLLIVPLLCSCSSMKYLSYDEEHVLNIQRLGYVTGPEAFYNTMEYGLGSCDLGYPLYVPEKESMYYFFGDSFSQNNQSGQWRSNVVSVSQDFNFSDGLTLDDALFAPNGYLKAIYNGHHMDEGSEVTKIPTGVIYVNNTIYMYYFSIFNWSIPNDNKMNYGGCIKSSDYGETWERIYDLTWVNLSPDMKYGTANVENDYAVLKRLINEDIDNNERTENLINLEDHLGFDSVLIFPLLGDDGYIYLFLEGGYRNRHLKLGRVLPEKIESFEEYEYLQGYDNEANPIYLKGYDGLKALYNNQKAEISNNNFGEMSGLYNPYLKKWCLLTVTTGSVDMYLSDKIYGPYQESIHLYRGGDEICPYNSTLEGPTNSAYAPMSHEKMLDKDGKVMYFLTSSWIPCYNPSLYEVTFK